jgi:hypothetical protein
MNVDIISDYPYFGHKKLTKRFMEKKNRVLSKGAGLGTLNVGR